MGDGPLLYIPCKAVYGSLDRGDFVYEVGVVKPTALDKNNNPYQELAFTLRHAELFGYLAGNMLHASVEWSPIVRWLWCVVHLEHSGPVQK